MSEPDLPPGFEDALRAELAAIVAAGPQPDDARLDALETRSAPRPPRRRWTALAAAAVVLVLVGIGVVVVRSSGDDQRLAVTGDVHACGEQADIEPSLPVPAPYRDEDRLLVPLSTDLGRPEPGGAPTTVPGAGTAELRYPDGQVVRFSTAPGTDQDAAPSPFATTRAEADAEVDETATSATSGMTATGAVTTVASPVPVRRGFLESVARDAAELPETIATAVAAGTPFPPIEQSFEVGGHEVARSIEFTDGIVHVSTDLVTGGTGGLRSQGGELSMLVGAVRPEPALEFESGGRYQWLVFVPNGLDVTLDPAAGDRCTAVVGDDLTGGEYWLIRDGNADEEATLHVQTTGRPTEVTLAKYVG